jgi:hypothetical protein
LARSSAGIVVDPCFVSDLQVVTDLRTIYADPLTRKEKASDLQTHQERKGHSGSDEGFNPPQVNGARTPEAFPLTLSSLLNN